MRWVDGITNSVDVSLSKLRDGERQRSLACCSPWGHKDLDMPLVIEQKKVRLVKAMVFPVVMYGCESWTVKEAEHQRIDAFELWCWRRLLRVPCTARRSNQPFLKEINPEYSLEGLRLKLEAPIHWPSDGNS